MSESVKNFKDLRIWQDGMNLAEGFRRKHTKEYKQFLGIALGSCGELETQIEISKRLGYLTEDRHQVLINKLDLLCRMTQSLVKKL